MSIQTAALGLNTERHWILMPSPSAALQQLRWTEGRASGDAWRVHGIQLTQSSGSERLEVPSSPRSMRGPSCMLATGTALRALPMAKKRDLEEHACTLRESLDSPQVQDGQNTTARMRNLVTRIPRRHGLARHS